MLFSPSLEAKKQFIAWFMKNYSLPKRESQWILNYLLNHEIMLNHVHFVQKVETTPRGIMFVVDVPAEDSFVYCKEGHCFKNPEQAFHDLRLNWKDACYVEVDFPDAYKTMVAFGVLEDNPYHEIDDIITEEVEEHLANLEIELLQTTLELAIDQALEKGDQETFYRLVNQLQNLNNTKNSPKF